MGRARQHRRPSRMDLGSALQASCRSHPQRRRPSRPHRRNHPHAVFRRMARRFRRRGSSMRADSDARRPVDRPAGRRQSPHRGIGTPTRRPDAPAAPGSALCGHARRTPALCADARRAYQRDTRRGRHRGRRPCRSACLRHHRLATPTARPASSTSRPLRYGDSRFIHDGRAIKSKATQLERPRPLSHQSRYRR